MQGPIAARMRPGSAPSATIAATVVATTPPSAPFQPAWAAPMTEAAGSARRTGTQSAVRMPRAMPGRPVTSASARGLSSRRHGASTVTTSGLWIWWQVTRLSGARSSAAIARARFSATLSGASPEPKPQFSEPNRPALTPPARVKKAWRTPVASLSVARLIIAAPSSAFPARAADVHRLRREPGRHRQAGGGDTKNLEQRAHFRRLDQAPARRAEIRGLNRGGAGQQALAARREAEALQERALRHRTPEPRADRG